MNDIEKETILSILRRHLPEIEAQKHMTRLVAATMPDSPAIKKIKQAVNAYFNLPEHDLESPKRDKQTALARQIAYYLSYTMTDNSYPAIGKMFANRDHTTVMYGVKRVDKDKSLKLIADDIRASLLNEKTLQPISRHRKREMVMMDGVNYA